MYEKDRAGEAVQSFAYERKEDSAVIWRCFSHDSAAEIPEQIDGYRVAEIAPYAFSAHMDESVLNKKLEQGEIHIFVPEALTAFAGTWKPLCGSALEEIVLPKTVKKVGRYCFYDCSNLRRITFSGELSDWGSGVFTRCHQIHELQVSVDQEGKSYLKDVLDELPEEVRVEYYCRDKNGREALARLIFPEFYEEGVENTPARILETHVHGSGISYRNCFQERKLDFAQYDMLFPYARAWERSEMAAALAAGRLRFPVGLGDKAKKQYESYVIENSREIGTSFLDQRDLEGLRWLLEEQLSRCGGKEREKLLDDLTKYAAGLKYPEAAGYLMNCRRSKDRAPRRRMEL